MYRVMAGIEIDEAEPGYKHALIQPQPGGGFTSVKATHNTMYGALSSAWTLSGNKFELDVEIPANTRATVRLPQAELANVMESGEALTNRPGISTARQEGEAVTVEIGSGRYHFVCGVTNVTNAYQYLPPNFGNDSFVLAEDGTIGAQ
jgi:alpha-L-rhamnosidase